MPLHILSSLSTKKGYFENPNFLDLSSMIVVTWYTMRGLNQPPPLGNRVIKYIPCPALTWGLEMYYEAHWLRYVFPTRQVSGSFHPQFPQQYPKEIKHNITLKKKSKLTILLKNCHFLKNQILEKITSIESWTFFFRVLFKSRKASISSLDIFLTVYRLIIFRKSLLFTTSSKNWTEILHDISTLFFLSCNENSNSFLTRMRKLFKEIR